jgi:ribulose-phosphate 3-epimerase
MEPFCVLSFNAVNDMSRKFEITASLICGDPLNLECSVRDIIAADIDRIHFDVMDGVCVPRFGLYPEILVGMRKLTDLPVDVHMMVTNPEPHIETYAKVGATIFYVHAENNSNLHRTLKLIRDAGMKPGVVLNMATPVCVLDYILADIDFVLLMAINPGIVGHTIIDAIYTKIRDVKTLIGRKAIQTVIDGGVTPESSAEMVRAGADVLVCGNSTIFRPGDGSLPELTKTFRKHVDAQLEEA